MCPAGSFRIYNTAFRVFCPSADAETNVADHFGAEALLESAQDFLDDT